jgi:hypothetical protein
MPRGVTKTNFDPPRHAETPHVRRVGLEVEHLREQRRELGLGEVALGAAVVPERQLGGSWAPVAILVEC